STLFNRMTGADVFAKDMLFATLDPTMRAVTLPDGTDVILSDTVGFISDLPTELVAAFRATLEEVTAADLIVHVRDISHAETESQKHDVEGILDTLGIPETAPRLELWNKADQLTTDAYEAAQNAAQRRSDVHLVSALTGDGLDDFLADVAGLVTPDRHQDTLHLAFADGKARAWLYDQGVVQGENQSDTGFILTVDWTARQAQKFAQMGAGSTV
ncbi:MAG: GTPase, partial [Pseudomonadota bacterium]